MSSQTSEEKLYLIAAVYKDKQDNGGGNSSSPIMDNTAHDAENAPRALRANAYCFMASLLQKHFKIDNKNVSVTLHLEDLPILPHAALTTQSTFDPKSKSSFAFSDHIILDYALLYGNAEKTWIDVVKVEKQSRSWWPGSDFIYKLTPVASFMLREFVLSPSVGGGTQHRTTSRTQKSGVSGTQDYKSWHKRIHGVIQELEKKLQPEIEQHELELSCSVLSLH